MALPEGSAIGRTHAQSFCVLLEAAAIGQVNQTLVSVLNQLCTETAMSSAEWRCGYAVFHDGNSSIGLHKAAQARLSAVSRPTDERPDVAAVARPA